MQELSSHQTLKFIETNFPVLLEDLKQVVAIDSGTHNKIGVDKVGDWIKTRMLSWGWDIGRHEFERIGDFIFGSIHGNGKGHIILLAHMDTVFSDGTAASRPVAIEGNRVKGAGVCDMKSGLLSGLWAMRAIQTQGINDFECISLCCVSDEEDRSPEGARFLLDFLKEYDGALVLEAARPNGTIVSSRKGAGKYSFRVIGVSAHAGTEPEKGANAVAELAHHITAVTRLNAPSTGVTISVNRIEGGTKFNVIPDFACAEVDVRVPDRYSLREIASALQRLSKRTYIAGTSVEIDGFIRPAMPKTEGTVHLLSLAQRAALRLGFEISDAPVSGGTSDANYAAEAGIPVLDGLGPIGGDDHTEAEYVLLDSIVPRTTMLALLVFDSCREYIRLRQMSNRSLPVP
jgi:glutamate carboxypeptidase